MNDPVVAQIRARVGRAIRRGPLPAATTAHPGHRPASVPPPLLSPDPATHSEAPGDEGTEAQPGSRLLERFVAALALVGGTARSAATLEETLAVVRDVLADVDVAGPRRFVAWDDELVRPVVDALVAEGWTRVDQVLPTGGEHRARRIRDVAACAVGVTSAVAALADTGSIVLATGDGCGRLASLLPPVHVAIVPASRLHVSLAHWLHSLDATTLPANLVVITGPSRTADIEQTLSRGVHGPKAVHVVVVPDWTVGTTTAVGGWR